MLLLGVDFYVLLNNSKARPSNDIEVEGFVAKIEVVIFWDKSKMK